MNALRFVNVFAGGLVAGGLFIVLVAYARALRDMPAADISRLHARFHPPTHRSMQMATIVGVLSAILIALLDHPRRPASTVLVLAGIPGAALQAVLSRFWVVPWSHAMIAWSENSAPDNHAEFVRRWTILHGWRAVGAAEAFVCYLLSLLLR